MSSPPGPAAGLDESIHPRFQESGRREPRQAPDGVVHLPGGRPASLAAEEVAGQETQLVARLHPAAHRGPESIDEPPRDPRRAGPGEPPLGLAVVEEKVA